MQLIERLAVREVMTTHLHVVRDDADILDAAEMLLNNAISGAPVVNEQRELVGVISEKDCLRLIAEGVNGEAPHGSVREFMTKDVETVSPNVDVHYAAGLFLRKPYRRLPVVENGRLVGQVSRRDILRVITGVLTRSTAA